VFLFGCAKNSSVMKGDRGGFSVKITQDFAAVSDLPKRLADSLRYVGPLLVRERERFD